MRPTNTHKGKTAWISGGPTEDRQICCRDWHSSVKANDKKKKMSDYNRKYVDILNIDTIHTCFMLIEDLSLIHI